MNYQLNHLQKLEAESIFILREAVAQFEQPIMLFSGGKDSILMSYLARKAFYPAPIPFALLHIDTGHNFAETLAFRDQWVKELGVKLEIASVQNAIDEGLIKDEKGWGASRNTLQTSVLLKALADGKYDAAFGGARRDEEKARAKERFFSHRNEFGEWDPKNQRPELWNLFNGKKNFAEHFRIFPISNWTELDVWQYLAKHNIPLPSLYFSHKRACFIRDNVLYAASDFLPPKEHEIIKEQYVRFRTIGDMTCTGAVSSTAKNIEEVITEIAQSEQTERGTRADDQRSETAMEDRKRFGYF